MADTARPEQLVYTTSEAAPLIHPNLSPRTMERWRHRGTGPRFVRVGRMVGYTRQGIEDWLQHQTRQHTAQARPSRRYDDGPEAA